VCRRVPLCVIRVMTSFAPDTTFARHRFRIALPSVSQEGSRLFEGATALLRRIWLSNRNVVFGAAGGHGPMENGAMAAVFGSWGASRCPFHGVGGVSIGCLLALALVTETPLSTLAAINAQFPFRDVFGSDLIPASTPPDDDDGERNASRPLRGSADPATATAAAATPDPLRALRNLTNVNGFLEGYSLKTVVYTVFREMGIPFEITFAEMAARYGKDLRIAATDLATHRLQVFSAASTPNALVFDAVAASMSIPILFRPQGVRGHAAETTATTTSSTAPPRRFVDGGVVDPFGVRLFEGQSTTLHVCKVNNFDEHRKADSIGSVFNSAIAAASRIADMIAAPCRDRPFARVNFIPLLAGARRGIDERDLAGHAMDLFETPPFRPLLRDGGESVETMVLLSWIVLVFWLRRRG
jgi:predicted acylesterase/phospholipase RssA